MVDPDRPGEARTREFWEYLRSGTGEPSPESGRRAAIVFGLVVAAAVPLILRQGRDQWFFLDEWALLTEQDIGVDSLLKPHNEHLILLPRILYRVLFRTVGLSAYWPYQAFVIGAHLTSAVLLRVVMRRGGVRPWIATAVAAAFVVFGSGRQDIVWAFQITFTGALAFGLAQLLLSDHDGPFDWRDAAGLACGLGAILSSSVGVIMVGVVGLSLALRGAWRAAVLHVVPLAVIWLAWWWTRGRDAYQAPAGIRGAYEYAIDGLFHAFARLGQVGGLGVVLGVALVAGVLLATRSDGFAPVVRRAAPSLALLLGGLAFLAVTGFARAGRTGNDLPQATRYVYLTAAMLLPILGFAIEELGRRSRGAMIVACTALAVGVPGNIAAFRPSGIEVFTLGREEAVLVGANLPEMQQVPGDRSPFSWFEGAATADWLRSAVANGRIPEGPSVSPVTRATIALEVALDTGPGAPRAGACPPLAEPLELELQRGDAILFGGGDLQVQLRRDGVLSEPTTFPQTGPQRIEASAGPLDLVLARAGDAPVEVCLPGDVASASAPNDAYGAIEAEYEGTGPEVVILGDSLTVRSREELRTRLSAYSLRVGALVGEGLSGGPISEAAGGGGMPTVAARFAEDEPAIAVIALGTNDATLSQLTVEDAAEALGQITDAFEGSCIVTLTVTEQGAVEGYDADEARRINELLRSAGDEVVPWAERSNDDPERYLEDDRIHPSEAGRSLFAELMGDAIDRCRE